MSNIYYWEKLTFWKLVGKVNLKENLKKCTSFDEQKGTRYIWRNIIVFSCHSSTRACLRFLLICFAQEIKGFQSSLGNEVEFWDIINISLKNYGGFSGWKSTDSNDVNIFLSLKNPFLLNFLKNLNFWLAKGKTWKRICNINSEKLAIEKKWPSQNFDFLRFWVSFWRAPTHAYHSTFSLQLKNQRSRGRTMCGFSIILILKGIMTFLWRFHYQLWL